MDTLAPNCGENHFPTDSSAARVRGPRPDNDPSYRTSAAEWTPADAWMNHLSKNEPSLYCCWAFPSQAGSSKASVSKKSLLFPVIVLSIQVIHFDQDGYLRIQVSPGDVDRIHPTGFQVTVDRPRDIP